ncbi:hypothetical protein N665_0750s0009 [Sinapis alba]|nr:hypothetical protein N665_0750s0009 [Sinapis alba]
MDQRTRRVRNERPVAASYRRERRPQTLKHTAPTASNTSRRHNLKMKIAASNPFFRDRVHPFNPRLL